MKTEEKVYTISDVADELGVSKTTVSRAISGKGRISSQTRERVLEFIKVHDYQPNVLAKGLAQSKTFNLALVLPMDFAGSEISFFQECMHGICEMAAAYNYDVVIVMTESEDLTQVRRVIANRKVDGIILSRSVTDSSIQRFLREKKMPFVVIGYVEHSGIHWVDNRNQEASKELTGIMLMKGMHRLALLEGNSGFRVTESRRAGFLEAHKELGTPADESLIFSEVDSYLKAMKAVEQVLEAEADGIVCMDDYITNMVLGCLREKRIAVPSQIKLASLYDSQQLEKNTPPVTSLHFDTRALGKNACLDLMAQLGEKIDQEKFPMNYQVILRESTK
ncbi:LacI family DNA-binding transcriptional regulator [Ruminococcus sp. 5_1_39BFAA]|uniref:LacI family DNA-binding transcriptional regulator n=1 Tax=Ruminococcus sp. 5_1_39BFAA TaxID=457412 RepID=UPI003569A87E